MAGTRSSARQNGNSSPPADNEAGTKRKASTDGSPSNTKRGKKEDNQTTLEQSGIETTDTKEEESNGVDKKDSKGDQTSEKDTMKAGDSFKGENRHGESKDDPEKALKDSRGGAGLNALDVEGAASGKTEEEVPHDDVHEHIAKHDIDSHADGEQKMSAIEHDEERKDAAPRNILEKGIIYFFTRGRVGVDTMNSVQDIQRTFFVLRPLPEGAKLGDGKIEELNNGRLFALPKKVFPKSSADKFMAFVEKAKVTIKELKQEFLQGSEYNTQTSGVRAQHPVTPIGEGVYAITTTGQRGESHLAYMLTIPKTPGELQSDIGLRNQGSFLLSLKNPESKGPANAALPEKPDWPSDFIEEFHGRSWMPAEPKHLDYANAQILMIGESDPLAEGHALEATEADEKDPKKETPMEEMEKLEHEDEIRVKHLQGDDTVYFDLGISKDDYPDVATTW